RAQGVRPDFQVTRANAAAVAELCRRLEGIPLAIELAAARASVLSPRQMVAGLERRFEILVSRQRDLTSRHRTLRAALDWSYHLLSAEIQSFMAQLSVFRGGWTLEAAERVCDLGLGTSDHGSPSDGPPSKIQEPKVLDALEELRECSLVLVDEAEGETRYRM